MLPESTRNFIRHHLDDDLPRLLLSAHRYPQVDVPAAVAQIEALRKVRAKIPAWFRFDLVFPPLLSVEQASSEQTARFKAGLFSGRRMADLTGGMGVDAYFFAQHFDQVFYVERQPELVALARHNFDVLGASNINTAEAEAQEFLEQCTEPFDLLYLDPARRDDRGGRVFQLTDCQPNAPALREKLLRTAPKVLLKTAPILDLTLASEQLAAVTHIWVVSVDNEVKEVLYLLERREKSSSLGVVSRETTPIEAMMLGAPLRRFVFNRAEEKAAQPVFSTPLNFLYEPDAAVLKAGAFHTFATRFGLAKLHLHTHLYTSAALVPDIPGRSFEIITVVKYDRRAVQAILPEGRANVAVRNFPDTAEAARKKLGLADGGNFYLFGIRDTEGVKVVVGRKAAS